MAAHGSLAFVEGYRTAHQPRPRFSTTPKQYPTTLEAYAKSSGLIPYPSAEQQGAAASAWDQDIMRHSFASCWLWMNKNAPELAEIMGNTVPITRDLRFMEPFEPAVSFLHLYFPSCIQSAYW